MQRVAVGLLVGLCLMTVGCSAVNPSSSGPSSPGSSSGSISSAPSMSMPAAPAGAGGGAAPAKGAVLQVEPDGFADAITAGRTVINVHTPDQGAIAGTDLTIPFDQLTARSDELPRDRNTALAIYCMTGNMSAIAGRTLTELGYTDIVELHGGMQAWQAAGMSLIPAA